MRKLATLQKIAEIAPIEGADAIEKVRINGWWCVAKKGEFTEGDDCIYFEIDSLLPASNPAFQFLAKGTKTREQVVDGVTYTGYRLKTIRLRGQLSQGLALPLNSFNQKVFHQFKTLDGCSCHLSPPCSYCTEEIDFSKHTGADMSEVLGVVKYDPPIPAQLAGSVAGAFPSFLTKTDEERVQNIPELILKYSQLELPFYSTEKLDGTSITIFKQGDENTLGVCSRNYELKETEGNAYWKVVEKYNLKEKLPSNTCIQGELMGPGIQNNSLKLSSPDMFVFSAYDIKNGMMYDYAALVRLCEALGMKMVPVLATDVILKNDVPALLLEAEGKCALCPESEREGVVWRPMQVAWDADMQKYISFKCISNKFLLNDEA